MTTTRWLAEYAWLPGEAEPTADVLVETVDGRITTVVPLASRTPPTAGSRCWPTRYACPA